MIAALAVPPSPTITTASPLASGAIGAAYNQTLTASGGAPSVHMVPRIRRFAGRVKPRQRWRHQRHAHLDGNSQFHCPGDGQQGRVLHDALQPDGVRAGNTDYRDQQPLACGTTGLAYNQALTASGGAAPLTWSISSGSLPQGLSLGSAGVVSGIPALAGVFPFTVQVTDSNGLSSTAPFSLTIDPTPTPPTITTTTLATGEVGTAYNQTLAATGGTTPYTWSVISGALPTGLSLGSSSGVISGTPTVATSAGITIQATGGNGLSTTASFSLTIYPQGTLVTNGSFETGDFTDWVATDIGTPFVPIQVRANGYSPGYGLFSCAATDGVYSATSGFDGGGPGTIQYAHDITVSATTPLLAFDYRVGWDMFDYTGSTQPRTFTVTVQPSGGGATLATTVELTAQPDTIDLDTGVLHGTVDLSAYAGTAIRVCFNINVPEYFTGPGFFELDNVRLTSSPFPVISTGSPLPGAYTGESYNQTLTAAGGTAPYTWSVAPGSSLPSGLSLSPSGTISGIPAANGTFSFTIQVTDSNSQSSTKVFGLTVTTPTPPTITTASPLPYGLVSIAYSQTLAATGGQTPYIWSVVSGSLPAGLSLGSSSGVISGTPTAAATSNFTVQVTGYDGLFSTAAFSLTINAAPVPPIIATSSPLPPGAIATAYTETLAATGGMTPYTWSVASGSLPTGLSLSPGGVISGTPTAAGTANFSVQVTGADGGTSTTPFSLTIAPGPSTISHGVPSPARRRRARLFPRPSPRRMWTTIRRSVLAGLPPWPPGCPRRSSTAPLPPTAITTTPGRWATPSLPPAIFKSTPCAVIREPRCPSGTIPEHFWGAKTVSATPGSWTTTPLSTPIQLQAGVTYRVGFLTGGTLYYWRTDMSSTFPNGTILQGYESLGDAFPTSADGDKWCMVDLQYSVGGSVPVSPTTTGAFASGTWTGNITVGQPGTGIILDANDGAGHVGNSNAFNVTATADLAVSPATGITASGAIGGPFTPTSTVYTVSNTGTGSMNWTASAGSGSPWLTFFRPPAAPSRPMHQLKLPSRSTARPTPSARATTAKRWSLPIPPTVSATFLSPSP